MRVSVHQVASTLDSHVDLLPQSPIRLDGQLWQSHEVLPRYLDGCKYAKNAMVALHTLFYHYLNLSIHLILFCYVLALAATVVSASADENSAEMSAASIGATEYRQDACVLHFEFHAVVRLLIIWGLQRR